MGKDSMKVVPFTSLARHTDGAIVRLDDPFDDGQSKPRTMHILGACLIHPIEPIVDPRQLISRDPNAGISHHQIC